MNGAAIGTMAISGGVVRSAAVPSHRAAGPSPLGAAAERRSQSRQMLTRTVGRDAALRRAVQEPQPQQERLVDVLDRFRLLSQHRRECLHPDWPAAELLDDRGQDLAVGPSRPSSSISSAASALSAVAASKVPSPWIWA